MSKVTGSAFNYSLFKRTFAFAAPYKEKVVLTAALTIIVAFLAPLRPFLIQYTIDEFTGMINKIKSRYSDFNFTTDIITGFPGETEEDFYESVKLVEEIGFSHVHTFKYSVRNGTRAERMPNQIPDKIKTERSKIIRELALKHKRNYRNSLIGKPQRILIEKIDSDGFATGYGEQYVPVRFKADKNTKQNNFQDVRLVKLENGEEPFIFAEVIKS